jgi:hypothetical protein
VNLPACHAVDYRCNFGYDYASVVETGGNRRANINLLLLHDRQFYIRSTRRIVLLDLPHDLFRLADRVGDDDLSRRARPRDSLIFQFGELTRS